MKTLTTTEHQALVVAALGGPVACASYAAVAPKDRYRMRPTTCGCPAVDDFGTRPAVIGDWNRSRRPVGFVT